MAVTSITELSDYEQRMLYDLTINTKYSTSGMYARKLNQSEANMRRMLGKLQDAGLISHFSAGLLPMFKDSSSSLNLYNKEALDKLPNDLDSRTKIYFSDIAPDEMMRRYPKLREVERVSKLLSELSPEERKTLQEQCNDPRTKIHYATINLEQLLERAPPEVKDLIRRMEDSHS